jgi:hypothetical protein
MATSDIRAESQSDEEEEIMEDLPEQGLNLQEDSDPCNMHKEVNLQRLSLQPHCLENLTSVCCLEALQLKETSVACCSKCAQTQCIQCLHTICLECVDPLMECVDPLQEQVSRPEVEQISASMDVDENTEPQSEQPQEMETQEENRKETTALEEEQELNGEQENQHHTADGQQNVFAEIAKEIKLSLQSRRDTMCHLQFHSQRKLASIAQSLYVVRSQIQKVQFTSTKVVLPALRNIEMLKGEIAREIQNLNSQTRNIDERIKRLLTPQSMAKLKRRKKRGSYRESDESNSSHRRSSTPQAEYSGKSRHDRFYDNSNQRMHYNASYGEKKYAPNPPSRASNYRRKY